MHNTKFSLAFVKNRIDLNPDPALLGRLEQDVRGKCQIGVWVLQLEISRQLLTGQRSVEPVNDEKIDPDFILIHAQIGFRPADNGVFSDFWYGKKTDYQRFKSNRKKKENDCGKNIDENRLQDVPGPVSKKRNALRHDFFPVPIPVPE
jgi:hypothetical protein